MKVAYLLGSLNRGGTETLILDLFKCALHAKYEIIGLHRKNGHYREEFYDAAPKMHQISFKSKFDVSYFIRLRKILKTEGVSIIHAQQSIDAIFSMIACVGTSIKVVQTIHGFDYGTSFISRLIYFVSMLFCHATYFVSEYQKSYYLKRYKIKDSTRYDVVYNGINFEKIMGEKHPSIYFISEGRAKNRLQICMVGNFVRGREQNTICRFLKLLKEKGIAFDFYFVGKRNDAEPWRYDNCVEYCKANNLLDSVHFLGGRGDVPAILQQMDAFIYSTDHDTFGIAVIEAIAAGLPTFVNDWAVMKEVTLNGKYAVIYRSKDEEDLLDKFMANLGSKEECDIKAAENSILVRETYSIERHIERLHSLYSTL